MLKSKAKLVQSDMMFDWDKLDKLDAIADEEEDEQELNMSESKTAEPRCDIKVMGNHFKKIKEFLER